MSDWQKETEPMVLKGRIKVPYTWSVGETGTAFFEAIKKDRKIMGTYCPSCDLVFIPPRKTCGRCFNKEMSWRELGRQGRVTTFTEPYYQTTIQPSQKPFAYGLIKLDGADTALCHIITDFTPEQLKVGLRVEAVFKEDPRGGIMDIECFKPVSP